MTLLSLGECCREIVVCIAVLLAVSYFLELKKIFSNYLSFAFLKEDGSVDTWSISDDGFNDIVRNQLTSEVKQIVTTNNAYAALKEDGSVVTWGFSVGPSEGPNGGGYGGDSTSVSNELSSGVNKLLSMSTFLQH